MRLREESGFGLLELLIAVTMLNIGILAIVAAFNAGAISLGRANKVSNAAAVADTQMELFRGMRFATIQQDTTEWNNALADSTFTADTVYVTNMQPPLTAPKALVPTITGGACTASGSPAQVPIACDPSRVVSGPDNRSYRIDTYLFYDRPAGARDIKVVTVVVRDAAQTGKSLARLTSTFDEATG